MAARRGAARPRRRVIPGFGLTMGVTITMLSVLVLIPLASILVYATQLTLAEFVETITSAAVLYALATTLGTAAVAAAVNCVFGVILAWVLVRYEFPGKKLLDGLIELPFALPTAVAGITLSKMYSTGGQPGAWLYEAFGLEVSYTHLGIVVALVFVGIPFVVRSVQPVLAQLDPAYEEAAYVLGASRWTCFRRVVLAELMPAILAGFGLAFARGIGEYGSVIYISGNNVKEHTQVISYVVMQKLNYLDYGAATSIALVMLVISFVILLFINIVQVRQARRTNDV